MDVTILSGDRDLLQLATDKVLIRLPKTSRGKTTIENFHTQEVVEKYQVTPPQIIELKALMGDSADNIPGIPGVGEKTATKMIVEFGSIENAYAHLEEVKPNKAKESLREHYNMAVLSKTLATINTDSPIDYSYEEAELKNLYTPEAYQLCKQLEFKNLYLLLKKLKILFLGQEHCCNNTCPDRNQNYDCKPKCCAGKRHT